jgi:pimeloyl-ACP methyl ester carboxylesterase
VTPVYKLIFLKIKKEVSMVLDMPFECDSHLVNGFNLSYLDSGGDKTPLHFYHANGFPVSVYLPMMTTLSESFRVLGMGQRGQDGLASGNTSWVGAADDLIHFLDSKKTGPVVGVGHSIGGAATMIAAVKRPDLFSKLVLIDPAILPYRYVAAMALLRIIGKKEAFFLAKRARGRKNIWDDRNEAYDYFQKKSLFHAFDDKFLRSYVTYGLKESVSGGIELVCPPEAEARIFENYPLDIWSWPQKLSLPVCLIRGENSDVFHKASAKRFQKKHPGTTVYEIKEAGHLVPMEQPDQIITLIKKIVR